MNQSIIELTQKAKREPFNKLREAGTDLLVVLCDLIPLVPLGSITSAAHKGIVSIQDFLFIKKMGGFLETVESSDITDEQINNFKLKLIKSQTLNRRLMSIC